MHYVNTTFHCLGNSFLENGKVSSYRVIMFLCRVITAKFYKFIAAFPFFKDKKSKKLVAALKFLYFLTVLSLNSNVFVLVLFACKDSSPLYKSSKRSNHLKPENLQTLSLPSALKMPIKSH